MRHRHGRRWRVASRPTDVERAARQLDLLIKLQRRDRHQLITEFDKGKLALARELHDGDGWPHLRRVARALGKDGAEEVLEHVTRHDPAARLPT